MDKYKLIDCKDVTLDGKPAKISGAKEDYATIWQLENHGVCAKYAWYTVQYIVDNGGKFKL